jgi:hypothetical protein
MYQGHSNWTLGVVAVCAVAALRCGVGAAPCVESSCAQDLPSDDRAEGDETPVFRTVNVAWDASSEPDIAGYKLYYGTASGSYAASIDVGDVLTYSVSDLDEGATYYFAAKAYNTAGIEGSTYSNEVSSEVQVVTLPGTP